MSKSTCVILGGVEGVAVVAVVVAGAGVAMAEEEEVEVEKKNRRVRRGRRGCESTFEFDGALRSTNRGREAAPLSRELPTVAAPLQAARAQQVMVLEREI